ncbi:hypothetical protein GCM10010885_01200 [Alicyclobacillus cellulosilyticus]|uniref:Chorismate mutase domain-containing protein n=1 Tax=Alicyclobacillus cellulosilyticus TaxID=1003997 RepID=A0A917K087_9BACL|nr:chorismate mutase [Alicyclobacillus cellulosilyticus]GGI95360.1 hypothetical protein GCM10010885_01200 [Alicyclobacillus cellulosilyticus]
METDWQANLAALRRRIDALDEQLIECLAQRFLVAQEIARLKWQYNMSVVQADRAQDVERRYIEAGKAHQIDPVFMARLYQLIHEETCRMQAAWMAQASQAERRQSGVRRDDHRHAAGQV